jgi:hypothetical protein
MTWTASQSSISGAALTPGSPGRMDRQAKPNSWAHAEDDSDLAVHRVLEAENSYIPAMPAPL